MQYNTQLFVNHMLSMGLTSIGSSSLQVHKMKVNIEISLTLYYKHSFLESVLIWF